MTPRQRYTLDIVVCIVLSPLLLVLWVGFVIHAAWLDLIDLWEVREK